MYPRTDYEMSEEDFEELLSHMRPVPMIMVGSSAPSSQQENANRAWARLGEKMGFESATVEPIRGKGDRFFSAVPTKQLEEAQKRQEEEKKEREIDGIKNQINDLKVKLAVLEK